MKGLLAKLKGGWWLALLALVLISVLIWVGGPYLSVGSYQPLAGATPRLATILVLVLIWAGWLQWRQLAERRRAEKLSGELAGKPRDDDRELRSGQERAQLHARFQEAVQLLRRRRGGNDLYTLPWYALIGPPGSGKSTLLQHSGLNFPLAEQMGSQSLRGVGGTRDCEWWFADQAVFLDTAGRYTTQDSDLDVDAGAWRDFLKLLRRYRPRRPLNGVVVTMSLSDLLLLDDAGLEQHAQAIRRRLDELAEQLHASVPVYLMFTKADLVAGFSEFFDDLNPEQRRQVWGVTFPLPRTLDGSAPRQFADAFAQLQQRLNSRLVERVNLERDRARRAAILAFPQQFAALGERARQFVETVFAGSAYATPPLLRGAYFSSGTQEGTPIDRMMGAVARTFGLEEKRLLASGAQRRSYFLERLLGQVILRESGLAVTNPARQRRMAMLQVAGYAVIALLTLGLVVGMGVSYLGNRDYLARVERALQQHAQMPDVAAAKTLPDYMTAALGRADAMDEVVQLAAGDRHSAPWSLRWGLYQADNVGEDVRTGYLRQLNATLLPGLALGFRQQLSRHATEPQALYYYLKGYLMLGEPEHLQPDELTVLAALQGQDLFPSDSARQQSLGRHLQALLDDPQRVRAISLDSERVAQARATLQAANLSTLVYGNLKLVPPKVTPLRLDRELGLMADTFVRRSGTPLSTPLPPLYTKPAFAELFGGGISKAVERFASDAWVLGDQRIDPQARSRLADEVGALYERDYIVQWDALLDDLTLRPAQDLEAASATASKLASPGSPLRLLLSLLAAQTQNLAPASDPLAAAGELAKQAAAKVSASPGAAAMSAALSGDNKEQPAPPAPGKTIAEHFAALAALAGEKPDSSPLKPTLDAVEQLGKTMLALQQDDGDVAAAQAQLAAIRQQLQQLPPPLNRWLQALAADCASVLRAGARSALDTQVQKSVGDVCSEYVHKRYPFDPDAKTEIPLQNFGELFGVGGRFDTLAKSLQNMIDSEAKVWRWKSGPDAVQGPADLPPRLQLAERIEHKYFQGGAQPKVGFTVLAPSLDDTVSKVSVNIDGQTYDYSAGGDPSAPMTWPGPTPGHVSIAAFDAEGKQLGRVDYLGEWALFRALQAGSLSSPSDLRFVAHFDLGGHAITLPLRAANLHNPFLDRDVRRFRCGS